MSVLASFFCRRGVQRRPLVTLLVFCALTACGSEEGGGADDGVDVPLLDGAVAPGSEPTDAGVMPVIPARDTSSPAPQADPAPSIFSYHAWDDEVYVVMASTGCFEARVAPGTCAECMTKVTIAAVAACASPSALVRTRVGSANKGVVVTNPVLNTRVSERAICDAELGFQRRFGMSEQGLQRAANQGYAPLYRERADDRLSTVDFAPCLGDAAPRLRAAFYPWSQ